MQMADPELLQILSRLGVSKERLKALQDQKKEIGSLQYQAPEGRTVGPGNLFVAPTGMNYLASVAENLAKKRQAGKLDQRMTGQLDDEEKERAKMMEMIQLMRQNQGAAPTQTQGVPYDPMGRTVA